jgi:hypothetical protein
MGFSDQTAIQVSTSEELIIALLSFRTGASNPLRTSSAGPAMKLGHLRPLPTKCVQFLRPPPSGLGRASPSGFAGSLEFVHRQSRPRTTRACHQELRVFHLALNHSSGFGCGRFSRLRFVLENKIEAEGEQAEPCWQPSGCSQIERVS